jgi:hypothetical protein
MRKLVATELMSMDGVVESPDEWAFSSTVGSLPPLLDARVLARNLI